MTVYKSVHPPAVGDRFERVTPVVTTMQLVKYAGASDDYNRIHYDQPYAIGEAGLGGIIAHGMLTLAFMSSAVTEWAGAAAVIRHLDGRFTSPVRPGDIVSVFAVVAAVAADGTHLALTAQVGDRVVSEGSAIVGTRS